MSFHRTSLKHLQLNAFGYATWKSYANSRKKAVEQEFTWSGFVISLSIAFLFVFSGSSALNTLYEKALHNNRLDGSEGAHKLLIERMQKNAFGQSSIC